MRVFEVAKEAGVTSAEVLRIAEKAGVEVTSAISPVDDGEVAALKLAIAASPKVLDVEQRREAKIRRAADLNAEFFAAQKAKLEAHLKIARDAAEGKAVSLESLPKAEVKGEGGEGNVSVPSSASASVSTSASGLRLGEAKPAIRMAPGVKPKAPVPTIAKTGLTRAGFKPLQHARPAATISITVASAPKPRPPKPTITVGDASAHGDRKGKKEREGQKGFDKRQPLRLAPKVMEQGSRISVNEENKEISIRGAVIVKDLAAKLNIKPNRLIADLMSLKILASINQRVEPDVATKVAEKYGFKVTIEHARDKAAAKPVLKAIDADDLIPEDPPETLRPRAPVITFLGHVDHGKTTLMDYIRKEHVAAGEAGGITQQISAYQVDVAGKKITFLDTPGHAAFSAMRARGAQITDIAVLIVAADDGIMPQTEECIKVCRQTGVQIMVAITKADKPTANVDRVKQQLQKRGLTPEDWGGDIICCPVSGVTGLGVDALLENILVQAEVLELQANPNRRANGFVIESELQQGLGPCATLLVTGGTLKVGDAILIGEHFGKVRALIDDHGRRIKEAPPATPVKCTGLSGVPEAGSEFRVMLDEKRARTLAEQTAQEKKEEALSTSKAATLDALMSAMAAEGKRELNVIVKSDTQGSLEAIVQALNEIKSEKVGLNVIGTGTGNVSLTDVKSAAAGKSIIVGFDIGNDAGVQQQARHDGVRINSFRIIYELIDHVKNSMLDLLPPEYKEVVLGHAEIKAIYDIGKLGKIAGSQMLDGKLVAKEKFRILRDKAQVWDGKVQTLRHFKDEVKEVTGQQECGVCFANYEGFQVGDTIECYSLEELPRSL